MSEINTVGPTGAGPDDPADTGIHICACPEMHGTTPHVCRCGALLKTGACPECGKGIGHFLTCSQHEERSQAGAILAVMAAEAAEDDAYRRINLFPESIIPKRIIDDLGLRTDLFKRLNESFADDCSETEDGPRFAVGGPVPNEGDL